MFINPDVAARLARERHGELLALASRRQLRRQAGHPAPHTPGAARIARRLAAAITRAAAAVAQAPGAIWAAGSHPLGEPAAPARAPRT